MTDHLRQALEGSASAPSVDAAAETAYQSLFQRNRQWVEQTLRTDPDYFARNATSQHPEFLFIGCSDSRVPIEVVTGAPAGEIFVHRNVANQAPPADLNMLSVLQYAVDALKVKTILVCGHYGCGGVRGSLNPEPNGFVDHWLGGVREVVRMHEAELATLAPGPNGPRERRLVELNAIEQARRLRRSPVVQGAWARGQALAVHALVYDVATGLLQDVDGHDATSEASAQQGA